MSTFSDNLTKYREQADMSRKELAAILGVSVASIGFYETGRNEPDLQKLIAIATALHVSIDDLLGFNLNEYDYYKALAEFAGYEVTRQQEKIYVSDNESTLICHNPDNITTLSDEFANLETFLNQIIPIDGYGTTSGGTLVYQNEKDFITDIKEGYRRYRENTKHWLYDELLNQFREKVLPAVIIHHLISHTSHSSASYNDNSPSNQAKEKTADPKASGKQKKD